MLLIIMIVNMKEMQNLKVSIVIFLQFMEILKNWIFLNKLDDILIDYEQKSAEEFLKLTMKTGMNLIIDRIKFWIVTDVNSIKYINIG